MSSSPVLAFDGLSGGYGDTVVVRQLQGQVRAGEVLGVLGRNGVGKTTLIRLLMGYARLTAGSVRLRMTELGFMSPHQRQRAGISYAPQEGVVFDELTVAENLLLRGRSGLGEHDALLNQFARVRERLGQRAGSLSGGEKKLVSFVRAVAEAAPVTLLDEPSEGVQPENIEIMAAVIRERCAAGAAFVLVEQNLEFLMAVMHSVLVLDHGDAVLSGSALQLDRDTLERHLHV
jgi:ABC-type branched-subunit amino acid transport system ATPase component